MADSKEPKKSRGGKVREGVKGVIYGMAAHGHVTSALRTRMYLEHLFMFITLGDMLGVPVIPPYYSLRILPYAVPTSRVGSSGCSGNGILRTKFSEGSSMGLSTYFEKKGDAGIVIFAGKGGLGKTTCSAGLSHYMASKRKRKVLCFSTDPQASLSDIFDRDIFGKGLIQVIPQLDVVEIDADRRVADYQEEVKQKIRSMYGLTDLPPEIEEYIDSTSAEPAMYESATYDAMADLVSTSGHDLYVFDMPPFGHGVRMIAMAGILSKWVGKITEAREKAQEYEAVAATLKGGKVSEDEVLRELQEIQQKITRFTDLMVDQRRTSFFMVLIPERMAILDTERALEMFDSLGLQMAGLIVNQVYPRELADAKGGEAVEFLRNRTRMQQKYLDEIRSKFAGKVVAMLPMYPREPRGMDMIEKVSQDLLFGPAL